MTSWVLNGRDPTEVKRSIEAKLRREEEGLAKLDAASQASAEITSGMVSILASFERRLEKLEETILPVYQETENLQRRQENIDRTLDALDDVIAFYNVSKEVETIVRAGPDAGTLQPFLQAMSRLKGALDYFGQNNPTSIELENVRALYESGGDALSREFAETIKRHSKAWPPVDLLNAAGGGAGSGAVTPRGSTASAGGELVSGQHFPEEVQTSLIAMAEWLSLNDRDEFMNVYALVRGQVMKRSLDQLKDHRRSASGGSGHNISTLKLASPAGARKFSSPVILSGEGVGGAGTSAGTPTGKKVSRISSTLNRKFSNLSTRVEAATGLNVGRRSLGGPIAEEGGPGGLLASAAVDFDVDVFCLEASALQKLMSAEQTLMVGVIPHQYAKKIFEIVVRDSLDALIADADAIIQRVRRANNDFPAILALFHVVRHLTVLKPLMDRTLEGCDPGVRAKYNNMPQHFFSAGSVALDNFVESVRNDPTAKEKMPKDGTVIYLIKKRLIRHYTRILRSSN